MTVKTFIRVCLIRHRKKLHKVHLPLPFPSFCHSPLLTQAHTTCIHAYKQTQCHLSLTVSFSLRKLIALTYHGAVFLFFCFFSRINDLVMSLILKSIPLFLEKVLH